MSVSNGVGNKYLVKDLNNNQGEQKKIKFNIFKFYYYIIILRSEKRNNRNNEKRSKQ